MKAHDGRFRWDIGNLLNDHYAGDLLAIAAELSLIMTNAQETLKPAIDTSTQAQAATRPAP